jgi:hypothetical protein
MHPELEALIQVYDAALEAGPNESARLHDEFEQRLQKELSCRPGLSEESLRRVIHLAHRRWLHHQQKPTTLPPKG